MISTIVILVIEFTCTVGPDLNDDDDDDDSD